MNEFTNAYLMITTQCNLRCPYCFLHKEDSVITKETIENSVNLLIKMAKEKKENKISITFFGGEPTLYPDLCEYTLLYAINKCKKENIQPKFSLITNGMRFDEEIQRFLLVWKTLMGNISVQLSYDGIPEVQRFNRISYKNAFDPGETMEKNIQEMKQFCEHNDIDFFNSFRIHSTISKKSLPYMFKNYKYFYDLGLSHYMGLIPEEPWEESDIGLYVKQLGQIFEFLKTNNPNKLKSKMFGYNDVNKRFNLNSSYTKCGAGKGLRAITPTGEVYTCHRSVYNNTDCIVGKIEKDGNFTTHNNNLQNFLDIKPDKKCEKCNNSMCRICKAFYTQKDSYGKLPKSFEIYCEMSKVETEYSIKAEEFLIKNKLL